MVFVLSEYVRRVVCLEVFDSFGREDWGWGDFSGWKVFVVVEV